jgi:hypothetical protein
MKIGMKRENIIKFYEEDGIIEECKMEYYNKGM